MILLDYRNNERVQFSSFKGTWNNSTSNRFLAATQITPAPGDEEEKYVMSMRQVRRRLIADFDEEESLHDDMLLRWKEQKRKRNQESVKELRWAVTLFVLFVVAGLILMSILLQHQHRRVILHTIRNPWDHGRAAIRHIAGRNVDSHHPHRGHDRDGFHHHFYSGYPRFVTVVMPSVVNPKGRSDRLHAIHDTWGPYARAVYVLHSMSEFAKASHLTIGEHHHPWDKYSYPQNLLLPNRIGLDDGVERLMYTIRTIYNRINPEFAFFVNDHTYVISSHLCRYLDDLNPRDDIYAGHALKNDKLVFNSGAAGYILSRGTMRKLIERWDAKDPNCIVDPSTSTNFKWLQGNPGLLTVSCLSSIGVFATDTRDGSYHRFHAFPLTRVVSGQVDKWYERKHEMDPTIHKGFDQTYKTLLKGPNCCSADSISFHYVEEKENRALFTIRHVVLNSRHISDNDLRELIQRNWPKTKAEIGAYSHPLPKDDDTQGWSDFISTIRKISTRDQQGDC